MSTEGTPRVFFTWDGQEFDAVVDFDDMLADELIAAERVFGSLDDWTPYVNGLVSVVTSIRRVRPEFPIQAARRWTTRELNRISTEITTSKRAYLLAIAPPEPAQDEARPTEPAAAAG